MDIHCIGGNITFEELQAADELMRMTKEELKNVQFDKFKIQCCVFNCEKLITLKDYGLLYLTGHIYNGKWINLHEMIFFCATHWKQHRSGISISYRHGSSFDHIVRPPR